MEQIDVNVNASGEQVEYYDLATVKQKIDNIEEIIGEGGTSSIILVPSSVTDITIKPGKVYVWTNTPDFITANIETPTDNKKLDYKLIFDAGSDFIFTLNNTDDYPIISKVNATIAKGLNKVCISCINEKYMMEVINYRLR